MVVVFSMLACGPLQQATVTSPPSVTSTLMPTLEQIPTLTATHTIVPLPDPTTTPTQLPEQLPEDIGPFRFVTSVPNPLLDPYSSVQVRALADGSVWIITSQEVIRWYDQTWEVVLSESEDFLAAVDDGGRLWVLRQDTSAIVAWQDGQWITYDADSGWTSIYSFDEMSWLAPASWSVYSDTSGAIWLPLTRDVRAFDGTRWSLYTLEDMDFPLPEEDDIGIIHSLAMREGGAEIWIGGCYYSGPGPMGGQGVRWFDGKTWYGVEAPVGSTCVSALDVDSEGNVWLGAYRVIWRYEYAGQSWTSYRLPDTLLIDYSFAYPLQLIVDHVGDVWAIMQMCGGASCSGAAHLYRIHNEEWSLIFESQDSFMPLKQLAMDGGGQVWLFWDGMVYQFEEESVKQVAIIGARSIDVSADGVLWVLEENKDGANLWVLEQ